MAWYWSLLLILAALLLLLCLTKVGVQASFGPEGRKLDIKIGPVSIELLPGKEKKRKKSSGKKEPAAASRDGGQNRKNKPKLPPIDPKEWKETARALWPPLKQALAWTRRRIRISPLKLWITVGAAQDPAAGAELYGRLHCGIWTVMPMLEQLLVIPDPQIHVGIDFDRSESAAEGHIGISARVWALAAVVVLLAVPAAKWFLTMQKRKQKNAPASPSAQETKNTAA